MVNTTIHTKYTLVFKFAYFLLISVSCQAYFKADRTFNI